MVFRGNVRHRRRSRRKNADFATLQAAQTKSPQRQSQNGPDRRRIHARQARWRRTALEPLEARLVLAANVVINEIMFHSPTGDEGHEYIELLNHGDQAADLTGWQFDKGVDFSFPAVTLDAGQYFAVASDTAKFHALYPAVSNYIGGWSGHLSNSSDSLELVNNVGSIVDAVTYADQGDWAFRERGRGRDLMNSITRSGTTATVTIPAHRLLQRRYGANFRRRPAAI